MNAPSKRKTENQLIRASAGTGKTYQLSSRYIELIARGVEPQEILATTFTRKAAGEILDRVLERLARSTLLDGVAKETSAAIGVDQSSEFYGDQLKKLVDNMSSLQIATLDAFFAQVARAYTLEMGLPSDWRIIEETDMDLVKDDAIRRLLDLSNARDIIHLLAKGDSEVTVGRLVRQTIDDLYEIYLEAPERAWFVIPDKKPRAERLTTIVQRLRDLAKDQEGARLPKQLKADADRLENHEWSDVIKLKIPMSVMDGSNLYFKKELPADVVQVYRELIDYVRESQLSLMAMQNQGAYRLLHSYDEIYQLMEESDGGLRFDSVNRRVAELLSDRPTDNINYRLDLNIRHLLLDEFQDTSLNQWKVLKPFALKAITDVENGSLFCVGDTKQAIYGWRGGVAEIFDEVESHLVDDDNVYPMTSSRRSAQAIIDAVNSVFLNAGSAKGLKDQTKIGVQNWVSRFEEHTTHLKDRPGYAVLEQAPLDDSSNVREFAAERVAELARQHPDKTIGVLVRTNKIVAELIFYLGLHNIRASEEGGNTLLDSAAVNLICALLKLIDHPSDQVALFHVINSPLQCVMGLDSNDLSAIEQDKVGDACQRLRIQIGQYGMARCIELWAGLLEDHCTLREWTRLSQLIEMAYGYADGDDDISIFRTRIESSNVDDPSGADVRVMTIHQAKGLEFDIVVLPHLDNRLSKTNNEFVVGRDSPTGPITNISKYVDRVYHPLMPDEIRRAYNEHIHREVAGELCNLYVAMTRAVDALYMFVDGWAKPENKEWQGIVLSALGENPVRDKVIWETGNPDWHLARTTNEEGSADEDVIGDDPWADHEYKNRIDLKKEKKPKRMLARTSPSRNEGGTKVAVSDLLRSSENYAAMNYGTLIHACFESIEWLGESDLETGVPTDVQLAERLALIEGATADEIETAVEQFRHYLIQPNIRDFLTRKYYLEQIQPNWISQQTIQTVEVENERAFAVRQDDGILQGFIDRLITIGDLHKTRFVNVIDFKSDKLDAHNVEEISSRVDWYRPQLDGYRFAVTQMFDLEPKDVKTHLVFVTIDTVIEV